MSRDIALIGLAGRFPKSPDAYAFWQNIVEKRACVSEPPPQAWDMEAVYDPTGSRSDRIYTKRGGFLGELATFNPLKHGVTPNAVAGTEPAQWLALEIARQAFDDAGFGKEIPHSERTAVIIGRGTYVNRANQTQFLHGSLVDETVALIEKLQPNLSASDLDELRDDLKSNLPPFDPTSAQGLIPNIIAGRIANKLNLMGAAYTVDAACASSIVALEQAVHGLRRGDFDMALVGGSYIVSPAPMTMIFAQLQVLSRQGEIMPFSAESDGTLLGEGIGMVVLKRLDDALADGNHIYATIKGVGTASDGSGRSIIAPRQAGAVAAMRRAYADAQVEPHSIGYIEAHGLGTQVGDGVEFAAFAEVYGGSETVVGTVKPMTGHLMPASGIAALIKTALSLHHGLIPATLNANRPNPDLAWQHSKLHLTSESQPWSRKGQQPLRAALNSFGFGGVAAHVVLEEAPAHAKRPQLQAVYDGDEKGRILLQTNLRSLRLSDAVVTKIVAKQGQVAVSAENTAPTRNYQHDLTRRNGAAEHAPTRAAHEKGDNQMTEQNHNSVNPLAPAMMAAYTDLMKSFLNVQRDVMLAALGGQVMGDQLPNVNEQSTPLPLFQMPTVPQPMAYSEPVAGNGFSNGNGTVVVKQSGGDGNGVFSAEIAEQALIEIVAERTGYPPEMIELDLDLEADLGIDSIKRVEILGNFQKRFGDAVAEIDMEDLAEKKSLREIVALVA